MARAGVKLDLRKLTRMMKAMPSAKAAFYKKAALRYLTFSQRRFNRLSRTAGEWPDLAESTKRARRGPTGKVFAHVKTRFDEGLGTFVAVKGGFAAAERRAAKENARREKMKGRKFAILVDTATLKRGLLQGSPGNLIRTVPNGIEVGIGGGGQHDDAEMTIGRLAEIHHFGLGNVPPRTVLTDRIDAQTRRGIQRDALTAVLGKLGGGK